MATLADGASSEALTAHSDTHPLTGDQVDKIKALIRLMKERYDPLPPQLETYLRLIPPTSGAASGEADGDDEAGPRRPDHGPMWFYCTSFLTSREWDVQKAFAMMQEVVAYRAANRLDEQSHFPPAFSVRGWSTEDVCRALEHSPRKAGERIDRVCAGVAQGLTCGIHYWDKNGRPVFYMIIDSFDEAELMRQLKQMASVGKSHVDVMWEYMVHILSVTESLVLYQLIQRGAPLSGRALTSNTADEAAPAWDFSEGAVTMVYDMKGLTLKMLWRPIIDMFCDNAKMFFKYYPDRIHRIVCVNSPSLVRYAFILVRGVLPATFQKKISFVSAHDTLATLETMIDRKYIPHFLGGECRCKAHDGKCLSGYDPQHPRRTRRTRRTDAHTDASAEGNDEVPTEYVTLAAGHECTRVFPVNASEVVVWEFAVEGGGHDIIFTTFFVPQLAASGMRWTQVELNKLSSYTVTSEALAKGSDAFAAAEDGVVVLKWRNRRHWFASRHLQFRAYKEGAPSTLHGQDSRSE
ncbi:CRAL/TRIO domain containing protein, putative [Leishmania donovani]|uniref:CRAL/TRIO domain containing protein, putative n=1 Tax=Leishmania donovani TaxID=5661 RepID=A0A3S7X4P4_LEIDO|nr:CRAL/TRIO domain containing protein, putative [Leishmania donovani]